MCVRHATPHTRRYRTQHRRRYVNKVIAQNLSKWDREKETKPFKWNWLIKGLGSISNSSTSTWNHIKDKTCKEQILIQMKKDYKNEVNLRTGGIALHDKLKWPMEPLLIKIGRDNFYSLLKAYYRSFLKTKCSFISTNPIYHFANIRIWSKTLFSQDPNSSG